MVDVKINSEELAVLRKAQRKLSALEAGGVDNWEWYDASMQSIRKEEELEELLSSLIQDLCELFGEFVEEPAGRGCGYGVKLGFEDRAAEMVKNQLPEIIKHFGDK